MPDGVIAAVEGMAQYKQQPLIGQGPPIFEWGPGILIVDDIAVPILQDDDNVHNDNGDEVTNKENEGADELIPDNKETNTEEDGGDEGPDPAKDSG
jgi:hypothetical protein